MTTTAHKVIIWCAVSSEEQAVEGKASIPDQLERQRARARANNWQIVDEIIVDGFSRRYFTFLEFAQDAARAGITAPMRMYDHWKAADFTILSLRDLSRIGREQSIVSEVVSRTIAAGAVVMPLDEATLDNRNYRMGSAISGIGASQHIDNLIRYREMGMLERAKKGLRISNVTPPFFTVIRDDKLEEIGIKPDREQYQRFFDDFPKVFVDQRATYDTVGAKLYDQFGHLNRKTGQPYNKLQIQSFLYSPQTWGHMAWGVRRMNDRNFNLRFKIWAIGDEPPPEHVHFYRDVVEPVWTSPTAERVKSELKMRHTLYKGRSSAEGSYMFSSFIYCDLCHKVFLAQNRSDVGLMYYRCSTRYGGYGDHQCENAGAIRQEAIIDWLTPTIQAILDGGEAALPAVKPADVSRGVLLQAEIDELQIELDNLAESIANSPRELLPSIQKSSERRADQMRRLQSELALALATSSNDLTQVLDQQTAAAEIRKLANVEAFWRQPDRTVNQWLHRYFGNWRLKALDREITGWIRSNS